MSWKRILLAAAVAVLAAAAATAQTRQNDEDERRRVRLLVHGLYDPATLAFTDTATFGSFLETATSTRSYDRGAGYGFEGGVIVDVLPWLGVMGAVELFEGSIDARFRESLPHPLFFEQARTLEGELLDLTYRERAVHLGAALTRDFSSLTLDVFGGPTLFFTNTQLISSVRSASDYPFDELRLVSADTVELDDSPLGFHAGGALTYRLTPVIGVAFQARYSRAELSVAPADGRVVQIDAGGFRAGGGLRISF